MSSRRRYLYRIIQLNPCRRDPRGPALAILLERDARGHAHLSRFANQFRLSARECEALELLSQGLTSKEIANRMSISPNTVKVFLRTAMIKTGVTTRSGIIGKMLQTQY